MQRQVVSAGTVWEPVVGYARAVRVGPWVAVAGTTAAADGGGAVGGDDVAAQTREALRRVVAALAEVGARLGDVVRTRIYVTDIGRWAEVGRVHGEFFATVRPASTMVQVAALIDPALLVEVEADAYLAYLASPPSCRKATPTHPGCMGVAFLQELALEPDLPAADGASDLAEDQQDDADDDEDDAEGGEDPEPQQIAEDK